MQALEFRLEPIAESVKVGRQRIRDVLAAQPDEVIEAAALLTNELVTNAIKHGEAPIAVEVSVNDERIRIAVADNGPDLPTPTPADHQAESGRGLTIIEKLADRWGVDQLRVGKRVWVELLAESS